jgi:serine/threonine protein kinase/formylglycine-generating enzyme required for sulfatase activity/uncharacterized membrane protein
VPIDAQRIQAVFLAATAIDDRVERARFLDGACEGDTELKSRVEALLRAHDQPDSLLDHPAVAAPGPTSQATVAIGHEGGAATHDEVPLGFLAPATRPDSRGRIGHYEVLQVLGHGGFGIVFRAFDDVLHRIVAVKVLSPQMAATSPARKRFLREARSSAAVRHENVVQVHEVGEQPLPYLVMEFIPGETLQQKLDRTGPLDVPEVLRIGRQIAAGLAEAHDHDLIHRDIKPGNVLLESGPHGRAKITDFGLARAADDASISQSGLVAGTPMYMAPEQAQGESLDHRADLFSLGSVLYQMVSGRPPFRANNTVAVLKRVAEDQPRAIREIIPEAPQWLCDIIAKLHAKNPDDRFQSAQEVADVLADCEAQLKANSKLKDFSRIPRSQPAAARSRSWKWVAAVALVLPLLALALTTIPGITYRLLKQQPTVAVAPRSVPRAEPKTPPESVPRAEPKTPPESVPRAEPKSSPATGRFALALDGENSVVKTPSLTFHDDHPLTVEAWAVIAGSAAQQANYDLVATTDHGGFAIGCPPSNHGGDRKRLAFVVRQESTDSYVMAWETQPVPRDQFVHLAGVYDGSGEIRFYVDGQLQNRTPIQGVKHSNLSLVLGGNLHGESPRSGFLGRINEVRISRVARYDADFTPARRFEPDNDTIALYHFDAGAGSVLKDSSGNGHHGEIVGATWVRADGLPIDSPPAVTPPLAGAPFDAAQAQAHQEAWAKQLGVPVEFKNAVGMIMRLIPPGVDSAGSAESSAPFYLASCEVTVGQFRRFVEETKYKTTAEVSKLGGKTPDHNPDRAGEPPATKGERKPEYIWNHPDFAPGDDYPVTMVTWHDAAAFCAWLSNKQQREYRLPTSVQWHWALRAWSKARYYFGDDPSELGNYAWHSDNSGFRSHPVGSKKPNPWGLFDIHGNVWELSRDWPRDNKQIDPATTSEGPGSSDRITFFGGSFSDPSSTILNRGSGAANVGYGHIGFRVAMVADLKSTAPTLAATPFTDADVQRIAALPAAEQVDEVRKELMRRNPGFDGKVGHKIDDGVVTELRIVTDKVSDISPIRVWSALRVLDCESTWTGPPSGPLADPTPLEGMNLAGLTELNLCNTKVTDAGMATFNDCTNLQRLYLWNTNLTDAGLAHFKDCKNLTSLSLGRTRVSDAGLIHFMDCKALRALYLDGTKVGDAGLAHFKDCKNLREVNLWGTNLTDAGLAHFKDCKNLTSLNLSKTRVSDEGLIHFKDCRNLSRLYLQGTKVSDAGLAHFKDCQSLTFLNIQKTKVTDLSLLKGMPLKELDCDFRPGRDTAILRSIKTLEKINGKPAAEFWKDVAVE